MGALLGAMGVLLMAFGAYRQAKAQGVWYWRVFLSLLGAAGAFIGLVIVPLCSSHLAETRPNLLIGILLGSILLFVVTVIVVARRMGKNWPTQPLP